MNILEIAGLEKRFGEKQVLRGLDLSVPEGSLFGFVGQNGAGKTTTMKLILGLIRADKGNMSVAGERVTYGETKSNRHIGFLPDVPAFYGTMKPMEYLALCGDITGMSKTQAKARGKELLTLVGLEGNKQKIGGFSRGMKQRLGIAQALLNEPKLLILDEPTSALDPVGRKEILDILKMAQGRTTVMFSTHILADVERICDHVAVLSEGKTALCGTLNDMKARHGGGGYRIVFQTPEEAGRYGFDRLEVVLKQPGEEIIQKLYELHITPACFEKREATLEDLFMEVVK